MIRNGSKWTIFASGGLGLLQMVLDPVTGRYASEDTSPQGGVDCEIPHWLERGTNYSLLGCGNLSLVDAF